MFSFKHFLCRPTSTLLPASSKPCNRCYINWTIIASSTVSIDYNNKGEFVPIALESHGPINRDALQFLSELGKRLVETTGDVRASSFLFQRISVVVLRFNSVLPHNGFIYDDRPE